MNWIKVLSQSELPNAAREVVTIGDRKVLVLNHNGKIYALNNSCPHLKLPLKSGEIKDNTLICSFHHSAFDLDTGNAVAWCTFPPLIGNVLGAISSPKPAEVFSTKIEEGSIYVAMAE